MILKVASSLKDYEWHYVDGLKRVSVSVILEQKVADFVGVVRRAGDILFISSFTMLKEGVLLKPDENMDQVFWYRMLDCVGVDGKEFTIYFDNTGFLLNDQGDTIDKYFIVK